MFGLTVLLSTRKHDIKKLTNSKMKPYYSLGVNKVRSMIYNTSFYQTSNEHLLFLSLDISHYHIMLVFIWLLSLYLSRCLLEFGVHKYFAIYKYM